MCVGAREKAQESNLKKRGEHEMKASEIGADELIREAVDLMDSGVAVGLLDTNAGCGSVAAITK